MEFLRSLFFVTHGNIELLSSLWHPSELLAIGRHFLTKQTFVEPEFERESQRNVYDFFKRYEGVFYLMGMKFEGELRNGYVMLLLLGKCMDLFEDDMDLSKEEKLNMLNSFECNLWDPEWCYLESKQSKKYMLEGFKHVSAEFRRLPDDMRQLLADFCRKEVAMVNTIYSRPNDVYICETIEELHESHEITGGIPAEFLFRLVELHGLEPDLNEDDIYVLSKAFKMMMECYSICEIFQDVNEHSCYWPREVVEKYVENHEALLKPENLQKAIQCSNEMILLALKLFPDSIASVGKVQSPCLFQLATVPVAIQVDGVAECYNTGVHLKHPTRPRLGKLLKIVYGCKDFQAYKQIVRESIIKLYSRISEDEPICEEMRTLCERILDECTK